MKASANVAASVKQRLLNLARQRGFDFNLLLTWYGIERLLFRLASSKHESTFVLKGAMLFHIWSDLPHRPTRDVDLLGSGPPDVGRLAAIFAELCTLDVEDDGLDFLPESVQAEPIREGNIYLGVRIKLQSRLGAARIALQVDVGFGDAIVPAPVKVELPTLLGAAAPRLAAYRRETTIAEKLHAIVDLGLANTRMKDYFDLWFLAVHFAFDEKTLVEAIGATFDRRKTPHPASLPIGLTDAFAQDSSKQVQWRAFVNRSSLGAASLDLEQTVSEIRRFLADPMDTLVRGDQAINEWLPGGPWTPPASPREN